MFVAHPLIRENSIESRRYQETITERALTGNTLVVAPTALGKTVISALVAAERLQKFPEGIVVMLSPTRPLVDQHLKSFRKFLNLPEEKINSFTGHTPPLDRELLFRESRLVCATPQAVKNDISKGRYSLEKASLIIFDEAHRCVGDYAYSTIAREYVETAKWPLILGLTASPGGEKAKIEEVKERLYIKNIEVRTESDPDVKPYVKGTATEWKEVTLPPEMVKIKALLDGLLSKRLTAIKARGVQLPNDDKITKSDLLRLRHTVHEEIMKRKTPELFSLLSDVVACINLSHASELLETQGLLTLMRYFERLSKQTTKAVRGLSKDTKFKRAMRLAENFSSEIHHPKLDALIDIVKDEVSREEKAIVFSHYRDTAEVITSELKKIEGIRPVRFVGQATRESDVGLSQKEQLRILEDFGKGDHNVLVATSVAEEGLDIPKVDLVVFYEPIPSEIRSIQRRGRTGRAKAGRVIVLITKGTRDEGFYWSSYYKERRMRNLLGELKGEESRTGQMALSRFTGQ